MLIALLLWVAISRDRFFSFKDYEQVNSSKMSAALWKIFNCFKTHFP